MVFRICFLISLLWIQIAPLSATKPPLDSLQRVASTQTGLERLTTQTLIVKLYDLPDGGSFLLCDSIFEAADAIGEHLQGVSAQLTKGHIYFEMQEFDLAMEIYKRINRYAVKHQVDDKYYDTFGSIAGVFEAWNQSDSAIYYVSQKIEYWVGVDTAELVDHLDRLSYYYHLYEYPVKSYETQMRLLAIGRALHDDEIKAASYTQIACLLGGQLDDIGAEEYYQKAIEYNTRLQSDQQLVIALANYGIYTKKKGDFSKADSLQRMALQHIVPPMKNWNKAYFFSNVFHNLASLYRVQQMWDSTIVNGRKSIQHGNNGYHTKIIAGTSAELVVAFSHLGQLDSAQYYLDMAISLVNQKTNPVQYRDIMEAKAIFLEKQGKFEEAYRVFHLFKNIDDSLKAVTQGQQLDFSSAKFKMDEKDLAIDKLTMEKQSADAVRNLFLILMLSLAVVAAALIYTYYFRAKKNKQLLIKTQEIDQLKSRFFANISHELRTPLTLILGPAETLLARANPEDKGLLLLIKTHSLRLKKLINQVLELAKIEAGKLTLQVSQQNFLPFLNGWVYAFKSQAENKAIHLSVTSGEDELKFFFQKDYLEHIINNLVHNAIKFSSEGGTVEVVTKRSDDHREVLIQVKDNGIGIPSEDLPFIFDRFYQVENPTRPLYEGTGIGLSLTKELVELHGGSIIGESTPGVGTEFTLRFPTGSDHFTKAQISPPQDFSTPPEEETVFQEILHSEEDALPLVLVVEDQDEVRAYLIAELSQHFQILSAKNGKEGLDIARQRIPDLILSDLMMPVMGGLEFASILKNDPVTDHIPFIMLTARGETEDIVEALKSKVDSYLTKPFNPTELTLRVSNLIQLKKNIREKYGSAGEEIKEEPGYSPKEVHFISSIDTILEEQLANEKLDVTLLADAMHLSRSQLFRKLRSITGESPSGYIRKFRLGKAQVLLQNEYVTVAEVSFLVGFNSPSYFSKCFSDQFGKSPGTLIRSKTE